MALDTAGSALRLDVSASHIGLTIESANHLCKPGNQPAEHGVDFVGGRFICSRRILAESQQEIVAADIPDENLVRVEPGLTAVTSALLLGLRHEAGKLWRHLRPLARGTLGSGLFPFRNGHGHLERLLALLAEEFVSRHG